MKEYPPREYKKNKPQPDCECGHAWNNHESSMFFWRNFEGNCKLCLCPLYKKNKEAQQSIDKVSRE